MSDQAPTTSTKPKFHSSLGTRFFIATMLIVILAVGGAVLVTTLVGKVIANDAVSANLRRAASAQASLEDTTLNQLTLVASIFGSDPSFAAYIIDTISTNDPLSAYDLLDERKRDLSFDLAIVTDAEGRVFARTDEPEPSRDDMSAEPLVSMIREGYSGVPGTWSVRGQLYYAASAPIDPGNLLQAILITGTAIGENTARQLREVSGAEVTFVSKTEDGFSINGTTLGEQESEELEQYLRDQPDFLNRVAQADSEVVKLDGRRYLALVETLNNAKEESVGHVISLASLDDQLEPFRRITRTLTIVGFSAFLFALVLSYKLKQRVSQPIERLAKAAQAAAVGGDYDQKIVAESQDEVGQLANALDSLLSDLREKRDMEVYIAELARTVPEEEGTAVPAEDMKPPEAREMALLGADLRGYSEQVDQAATPREALDRLSQGIRFIIKSVVDNGGQVQAVVGHRVLGSFAGNRHTERALSAGAAILAGAENLRRTGTLSTLAAQGPATPVEVTTAVALVSGTLVRGSVVWENRPANAVAGGPVDEVENLLRVARPGSIWLSQAIQEEMVETWTTSGVQPQGHRNPLGGETIFAVAEDQALNLTRSEFTATQNLTTVMSTPAQMQTLSILGPGSRLGDRFKILSQLGAGGMGVVYKARDDSLNELVALKMLKPDVWNDPKRLADLKDELKLARKIAHPNVLKTYDFGEIEGASFISMEYVRGITLRQLLDQSGRLPLTAGLRVARQICRGLSAAHDQSVVHRDIKPENLIVEHTGNVKLMDFGISQRIHRGASQTGETGQLVGTPYYLAPEQLQGKEADERADIYATGVVLYEIFTGQLPYKATGNLMQIITIKMKEPPAPPSQHWTTIPGDLERIILRCLERDPDQRYSDVGTLVGELEVLRS